MTGLLVAPLGPPERLFEVGELRADGDRVHGAMRAAAWMRLADGTPAAGVLGVLVDVVVGHATLFARPPEHWAVTSALSLDVARPLPTTGELLTVDGTLLGADASGALSSGTVLDAAGTPLAVATTRVRFTPGVPDFAEVASRPVASRPGVTTVLDALGGDVDRTDDGRWRLVLPPDPAVLNAAGVVHGGVVAAAAEVVAAAATADATAPLALTTLRLAYLRPVVAGTGAVTLLATVEHRGRTTSLVTVEAFGADGRRGVVASVGAASAGVTG